MILSTVLRPPTAPPEEKPRETAREKSGALEAYRRRSRRYDRAIAIGVIGEFRSRERRRQGNIISSGRTISRSIGSNTVIKFNSYRRIEQLANFG